MLMSGSGSGIDLLLLFSQKLSHSFKLSKDNISLRIAPLMIISAPEFCYHRCSEPQSVIHALPKPA